MAKVQLNARIPEELYNRIVYKTESDSLTKPQIVIDALMLYFDINDNTEPPLNHTESHHNTITPDNIETYQEQIRIIEENHQKQSNEKDDKIKILQETYQDIKEQLTIKDMQIEKMQITQQTLAHKIESRPMLESGNSSRLDGLKYFLFGNKDY